MFSIKGDFLNKEGRYEDIIDGEKLRKHLYESLEKYNNTPGTVRMNLVLFRDAIEHSKLETALYFYTVLHGLISQIHSKSTMGSTTF